jgi:glutaredoxin 3
MAEVTIYTRDFCGYCTAAKALLERKGIPYVERDATGRPEVRAEMIERSNGRLTFPQIFIGETHIGGCIELYDLEASGGLDALLPAPEDAR